VAAGAPRAAVIPAGREELFAAMLGRGAMLPEGCAFVAGAVEHTLVRGVYHCGGSEVEIELRHPSDAPGAAVRTDRLAIVPTRGAPPAALLAALQQRISEREGAFAWSEIKPDSEHRMRFEPDFPERYTLAAALLVAIGQVLAIALGLGSGLRHLYRQGSDQRGS
jgi:hypothetical protein